MGLNITIGMTVLWLVLMAFIMDTKNIRSMLFFKFLPFAFSIALSVFWAMERGYIINVN